MNPSQNPKGSKEANMEAMKTFLAAIYKLIPVFSGEPEEFDFFIRSIEAAKTLASPHMTHTLFAVVKAKIQGSAKELIKGESFKNWDELYSFLKKIYRQAPSSPIGFIEVPDSTEENQKKQTPEPRKIKMVPMEKLMKSSCCGTQVSEKNLFECLRDEVISSSGAKKEIPQTVRVIGLRGPVTRSQLPGTSKSVGQIPRPVPINFTTSPQMTKTSQIVQYVVTKPNPGLSKPVALSTAGTLVVHIPPKSSTSSLSIEDELVQMSSDGYTQTDCKEIETDSKEVQVNEVKSLADVGCQTEKFTVDQDCQTDQELTKYDEDLKAIGQLESKKRPCDQSLETKQKDKIAKINSDRKSSSVKKKEACSYCFKTGHKLPQCNKRQADILRNIRQQNYQNMFNHGPI